IVGSPPLSEALVAALFGGSLLLAVFLFYRLWRGIDGIGLGDLKLVAAGGLWCDISGIGPMLIVATASAGTVALLRAFLAGRLDLKSKMPFGPYLSLGIFAAWLLTHIDAFIQSPY
ncbi:MAG: prepilin peptidase, partial [Hyphomicrobiales bacterium]|nr:prepilin peptidase [Hyphomicrobiales bacterium]